MELWSELGVIVGLTLLNGVFTGAEIAMLSVRKTRLQSLADDGSASASAALALRRAPERLLATIQIGITVIGASTAVFGGARLEEPLTGVFRSLGFGNASETTAFTVVIVLVSYLSLVLGELVPKSLALRGPEAFALVIARPLTLLSMFSRPLVWTLTTSSNVVLRLFRDKTNFSESRLAPDELQQLVEESAEAGALPMAAGEMASRAIDLGRLRARALMVPRTKIASLPLSASPEETQVLLTEAPFSRYPVYSKSPENVVGYVTARDLYAALLRKDFSVARHVRKVTFFPEGVLAIDVLRSLQSRRQKLALLEEEQGGLAGLLTIEDIAEEILGDVFDEDENPVDEVWRAPDGSWLALGEAPVHEIERLLDATISMSSHTSTIAGLIMEKIGRVPRPGETVPLVGRLVAEIVESSARQIQRVRLVERAATDPPSSWTDR